jgi:hypothetical protein
MVAAEENTENVIIGDNPDRRVLSWNGEKNPLVRWTINKVGKVFLVLPYDPGALAIEQFRILCNFRYFRKLLG